MSQSVPYALSSEHCYAILAAMVAEIGEPPQQDMHFDYWHYSGQHELWGFQQSYAQSIIRKFVELKGGASPSLALCGPMDLFMAACAQVR